MSKRGRRRSSRRRKSSSSSKQSVSPYIFHKQSKSNSVGYKDDTVEKGEVDSLRKENARIGSEDEEKYNHAPPKEKRFKQDYDVNSLLQGKSIYSKTTEDKEKGVKIVTSVSVDEMDESNAKITFQQSHEPLSESTTSTPITNIMNINCSGSNLKLEIQEFLQSNLSGLKTTFVFMNQSANAADMFLNSSCERSWTPNNESDQGTNHSANYRFTFGSSGEQTSVGSAEPISPPPMWAAQNLPECCSDHRQPLSEFMLEEQMLSPPPVFKSKPQGKRKHLQRSFSADELWEIPPPREFADFKQNLLEELAQDLSSCRITDRQQAELHPPNTTSEEDLRRPIDRSPSFDQLSDCESFDPSLMRPSVSTNRSSFIKDFINHQQRKSWIRNNSISTVEHKACLIPKKRRQTYPGTSEGLSMIQDQDLLLPCSESFSSLLLCSLPLQAEGPETAQHTEDGFFVFGAGSFSSLHTKVSHKPVWEIPQSLDGNRSLLSPFYVTSSEETPDDSFPVGVESRRRSSIRYNLTDLRRQDFRQSVSKTESVDDADCGLKVGQCEVADSGFDQEMVEMELQSPEPLTEEELSRRSFMIQVIPPSCSGSEEHILQSDPADFFHRQLDDTNTEDSVPATPTSRRSSGCSVCPGALQQRLLQVDSRLSPDSCVVKHRRASVEDCCMEPLTTSRVTEETDPNSSPKTQDTDHRPALSPSGSVRASEFRELSQTYRTERQSASRSSMDNKEHLKPVAHIEADSSGSDHWAKRRKLFRESKQWSSAAGSSITSDVTEESVSEETRSMDFSAGDGEDRGFYTETFHSSAWIYQGDEVPSGTIPPSLNTGTRTVSTRERTVRISKGSGEYPWGFRIQFTKPIVVTEVDTNGAAEEAGLIVGDFVLAVNGTDVTSIPHSEAAELARQGPDILTLTVGSDIALCPNTPRPACRGYLHKRTQSGLIKGWRKRWFVLTHDCCLYYYRHKRDEGKRQALSGVKLEAAEVGLDVSLGKPFAFKCRPQEGNRVYFFCATSNQEMKRWLEAMEKAVHPVTQKHVWVDVTLHNSSLPPLAVKSPECLGLLHKMDRSRDVWVQHYCILKDGCLFMYSGIRATHARGGIYLQGYLVREQPFGSKKSTIELKPPSDEFKTFYLCAENPDENKRWIIALKASVKKWLPLHQALQDYMSRLPEETRM
ncbi:uncharacterized protein pdzph1 [Notolabrus celidotus]|uniref:uncharacterized protein pdzph1 n=1 Tax=Notolabrus celidotus TaxID=1203425 RepID=UPI00149011D3|nr:uncharacterized protein pdzph1 [Notolabrus celidotus]